MSSSASSIINVVVGTAGHIDHGKSSLVQALTGIDPDRLQEEKERGMTIDLGFARFQSASGQTVGIIDVPGHERFIKNMVAGATSVDVVMLVVAADDGVMPQTREHLEILTLLGVGSGMVVMTKTDLVDEELLELAEEDVRALVRGTFLDGAAILRCSNHTGEGHDQVRAEVDRLIAAVPPRSTEGLFRMPIQRVFSAKGHGTVATGVPLSGSVAPGDEVEILPLGRTGRVRGIQAYGAPCERARAGHSCALNLGDVDYREVVRGMVAAQPGYFRATNLLDARLQYLATQDGPLEHRLAIKLHIGTTEIMGRVRIVDRERLLPGEEGLVQLELEEAVVVHPGDRFLVRLPSPAVTLGGGVILGESKTHRKRLRDHHIDALQRREKALEDPREALLFAARERRYEPFTRRNLAGDLGLELGDLEARVEEQLAAGGLVSLSKTHLLSAEFVKEARGQVKKALGALHKKSPLRKLLGIRELRSAVRLPESLLKAVLGLMVKEGAVCEEGAPGQMRLSSHKPALSPADERALEAARPLFTEAALAPPAVGKLADQLGVDADRLETLLGLLCDEDVLLRVGPLYFDRAAVDRAREELIRNGKAHDGEVSIPDLRDALATSRKYMIPLLEHFDGSGLTVRRGDKRFLRESQIGDTSSS